MSSLVCYKSRYSTRTHSLRADLLSFTRRARASSRAVIRTDYALAREATPICEWDSSLTHRPKGSRHCIRREGGSAGSRRKQGPADPCSNTQIASLCGAFGLHKARITFVASESSVGHVTSPILLREKKASLPISFTAFLLRLIPSDIH